MQHQELRQSVLDACLAMAASGLFGHGTSGNVSVRVPDDPTLMLCTPSGMTYTEMTTDDILLMQFDGQVSVGVNLEKAMNMAQEVEWLSQLYINTLQLGDPGPFVLSDEEMAKNLELFGHYGQQQQAPSGEGGGRSRL
eukprot:g2309.t1